MIFAYFYNAYGEISIFYRWDAHYRRPAKAAVASMATVNKLNDFAYFWQRLMDQCQTFNEVK